eukprot:s4427_g2.t2
MRTMTRARKMDPLCLPDAWNMTVTSDGWRGFRTSWKRTRRSFWISLGERKRKRLEVPKEDSFGCVAGQQHGLLGSAARGGMAPSDVRFLQVHQLHGDQ